MTEQLTQAQIKFLQDRLKSQLEYSNTLKQLNQQNPEVQESIEKLQANIELLQTKLGLEKLEIGRAHV